jgi:hypothetical protein
MNKMFMLCSLLSITLNNAHSASYMQVAKCDGKMMNAGTMVSSTFTLMAEESFFCSGPEKVSKGLIIDHSQNMLNALDANVKETNEGVSEFSGIIDDPDSGRSLEYMKFELTSPRKATLSVLEEIAGREVVSKYEFKCHKIQYHFDCR